jgi:hypothetical protein
MKSKNIKYICPLVLSSLFPYCNSCNDYIEFVAVEESMLIGIQREILKTLQMQKCELIQIQTEMLQALKAAFRYCRPVKYRPSTRLRKT